MTGGCAACDDGASHAPSWALLCGLGVAVVLVGVIVHAKQKKMDTKTATPGITTGNDNADSGDATATTAVSQDAAGAMERSGVAESAITIGNVDAGNGDTAATTAVSHGSAGAKNRCTRCANGVSQRLLLIYRVGCVKLSVIMFNCQARLCLNGRYLAH